MPTRSLRFVVDTENSRLLPGFRSILSTLTPRFTVGDQVPVEVYLTKPVAGSGQVLQEVPFPAGAVLRVAVGQVNQSPTAGSWSLSYDGDETSALAFDASASAVQTALNALASITSAGGVTVSRVGDAYSIEFNTVGARDTITGSAGTLVPLSSVALQTLQEGTASVKEVVFAQVKVRPIALCETFSDLAAPTISRTGQTYSINGAAKSGSYNLSVTYDGDTATTYEIPYNANLNQIESAILDALLFLDWSRGSDPRPVRVVQTDAQTWAVSYWDSGAYLSGVNGANLVGFAGKAGTLSLNTAEALAFIGSEANRRAIFEVEVEVDGERQTLVQAGADVAADLVLAGAFEPSSLEEALSETVANARFVRRDADQSLDATSKDQIWENITGVTSPSGVDLVAALTGAAAPSGANVLATMADIPPAFDQDLNTTDSVTFAGLTIPDGGTGGFNFSVGAINALEISDGTSTLSVRNSDIVFPDTTVQTTAYPGFDQSLNTTDSPAFVDLDISGQITLSGFGGSTIGPLAYSASDGVITTQYSATGITFADTTVQESAPVHSAGTVVTGGGGSSITGGGYPDEIQIVIGGVLYAMPARVV
jgi:hypothetical protein